MTHVWGKLTGDQRRDIIKPLWLERGLSASDIALHFIGATRNAIIGVIHRSKFEREHKIVAAQKTVAKPKPKQKSRTPVKRMPDNRAPPAADTDRVDYISTSRPPLSGAVPIALVDLPNRPGILCRFPVHGGYCGIECGDDMYCETHHRYMYSAEPKAGPSTFKEPPYRARRISR